VEPNHGEDTQFLPEHLQYEKWHRTLSSTVAASLKDHLEVDPE
jgi:hypothetical protein